MADILVRICRSGALSLIIFATLQAAGPVAIGKAVDGDETEPVVRIPPKEKIRLSTSSCFLELAPPQALRSQKTIDDYVAKNPGSAQAHILRGYALLLDGDMEGASPEFDKALALDPHCLKARVGRSRIFQEKMRFKNAVAELEKAAENAKGDDKRRIEWEIAFISREHKQYPFAITKFTEILKMQFPNDKMHAYAILMRGETYARMGNDDDAMKDYNASIKLDADSISSFTSRGEILERRKKNKEALADFNHAINNGVNNEPLFKSVGITPILANAYRARARVETRLGMKDLAQQDLLKIQVQQHEYMDFAPFSMHQ